MHIPLVLDKKGNKLSKQTLAPAIDRSKPEEEAARAWTHLDSNLLLSILSTSFIQRQLSVGERDSKLKPSFCGLFHLTELQLLSSPQRQILRNFVGRVSFQKNDLVHRAVRKMDPPACEELSKHLYLRKTFVEILLSCEVQDQAPAGLKFTLVSLRIASKLFLSLSVTSINARPELPARPVLPIR